jgi:(1->4)-alpha-D-glucan 1-alpha-D-glucosylmutase
LAELDARPPGVAGLSVSDEKLLVTSRALRLRRDRPEVFIGPECDYQPVATTTGNAVAVGRGLVGQAPQVIAVATRLAVSLAEYGGWREHSVAVPPGTWRELLTGNTYAGGSVALAHLLAELPVALLVQD